MLLEFELIYEVSLTLSRSESERTPHELTVHLGSNDDQGSVDGPLSASDFHNDLVVFNHIDAHVPILTHSVTRSTGYTLPQRSWQAPVTTTQNFPLSTPSSYNASTAATPDQSTYDSTSMAVYDHPTTTTLDELPVTTQYQLGRWVYENRHDETTVGFLLIRYLRTANCTLAYRSDGRI